MAGERARRRLRVVGGRQERIAARGRLPREPRSSRDGPAGVGWPDRLTWPRILLGVALGVALLIGGIGQWRDHAALHDHGRPATAQVLDVHGGRSTWVQVRFVTAAGDQVVADLSDPPSGALLTVGESIAVRYDPADPDGRVEFVGDDQAGLTRWFLMVTGPLLLALAGAAGVRRLAADRRRGRRPWSTR